MSVALLLVCREAPHLRYVEPIDRRTRFAQSPQVLSPPSRCSPIGCSPRATAMSWRRAALFGAYQGGGKLTARPPRRAGLTHARHDRRRFARSSATSALHSAPQSQRQRTDLALMSPPATRRPKRWPVMPRTVLTGAPRRSHRRPRLQTAPRIPRSQRRYRPTSSLHQQPRAAPTIEDSRQPQQCCQRCDRPRTGLEGRDRGSPNAGLPCELVLREAALEAQTRDTTTER